MRPIDPIELSALIDGELDAGREAEVRAALAHDEALRGRYEALVQADTHLRSVAAGVTLSPRIRLPSPAVASGTRAQQRSLWRSVPVLVIPVAWLIGKLTDDTSLALLASAVALITLMVTVVHLVLNEDDLASAVALSNDSGEL